MCKVPFLTWCKSTCIWSICIFMVMDVFIGSGRWNYKYMDSIGTVYLYFETCKWKYRTWKYLSHYYIQLLISSPLSRLLQLTTALPLLSHPLTLSLSLYIYIHRVYLCVCVACIWIPFVYFLKHKQFEGIVVANGMCDFCLDFALIE